MYFPGRKNLLENLESLLVFFENIIRIPLLVIGRNNHRFIGDDKIEVAGYGGIENIQGI
jgi:hypothetical protein